MGDIVRSGRDGTVYIAERDTLYRVKAGKDPAAWITQTGHPRALCEMPDGSIFLAADRKFIRILSDDRIVDVKPPAIDVSAVWNCAVDRDGSLWLSVLGEGWFKLEGSNWRLIAKPEAAMDQGNLLADRRGGVLISPSDSNLVHVGAAPSPKALLAPDSRLGAVIQLFQTEAGPLARGMYGMALLGSDEPSYLSFEHALAFRGMNGLVDLPDGTSWGYSHIGIFRFQTADLAQAFETPSRPIEIKVLDASDGLTSPAPSQGPQAAAAGGDGRLWFATDPVVMMVDTRNLSTNAQPPGVKITALVVDGHRTRDPTTLELPAGSRELQISFSALSLQKARKIQIRYRLEGFEDAWVDPGLRREAFYTNLAPGTYRFHVIAANSDGVWNREGAELEIALPPTFLQSAGFKLLVAVAALVFATLIYRLRIRQVTSRLHTQFSARVAERERIARELHDTLLQGVQGLILRFQGHLAAAPSHPANSAMNEELALADEVLNDSRARIMELRTAPGSGQDLVQELESIGSQMATTNAIRLAVEVSGDARPLRAELHEELRTILTEALLNAYRHSEATRLSVRLAYGRWSLHASVQDNGHGIPAELLRHGRPGHLGLASMRERAGTIGARFSISSGDGEGTLVQVKLSGFGVFADVRQDRQPAEALEAMQSAWQP